jgi:hypothetical protein
MADKKKAAKKTRKPSTAKLKRHYREKERRTKAMRAKPPGAKEKLISGCMAAGLVGAIVFLAAVTWTCVFAE